MQGAKKEVETTTHWLRQALPTLANEFGQLPPERDLARRSRTSMNNLRKVLSVLEGEGLLERKQGKGTFIHPHLHSGVFRPVPVSPAASAVKTGEGPRPAAPAGTLGVLAYDDNHGHCPAAAIYHDIMRGLLAETQAAARALSLSMCDSGQISVRRFLALLDAHRVDSVALLGIVDPVVQQEVAARQIPAIVVDHWATAGVPLDYIMTDSEADTREAVQALAFLGHRRIAYLDRRRPELNPHRRNGYEKGLAEARMAPLPGYYRCTAEEPEPVQQALQDLLALPDPPSAIIACSGYVAALLVRAAAKRGLQVPGALSVVGFGGLGENNPLGLSCVVTDFEAMGRLAARRLAERLAGQAGPPTGILLPGQYLLGQTTALHLTEVPLRAPSEE